MCDDIKERAILCPFSLGDVELIELIPKERLVIGPFLPAAEPRESEHFFYVGS